MTDTPTPIDGASAPDCPGRGPDHHHPALLRLTLRTCPADDAGVVVEVDVGTAVPNVSAEQAVDAVAHMLAHLEPRLDRTWRAHQALDAMRN